MMSLRTPIAVRLPRGFALGRISMAQALSLSGPGRHRAIKGDVRQVLPSFRLHPREHIFATTLLLSHTRIWLWRTHQQRFAGDFALVDMSSPDPRCRRAWIVDLKLGATVKLGGGGAGNQLSRAAHAIAELVDIGVLGMQVRPRFATGDGRALLPVVTSC
jgi:hypothetical protein